MPVSIRVSELSSITQSDLTNSDLFLVTDSEAQASKSLSLQVLKQNILNEPAIAFFSNIDINSDPPQEGQTLNWSDAEQRFVPGDIVGSVITRLDQLTDVDILSSPPQNGDVITWNGTAFVPSPYVNPNDFITTLGITTGQTDLGDFDTELIPDDIDVKAAFIALASEVESEKTILQQLQNQLNQTDSSLTSLQSEVDQNEVDSDAAFNSVVSDITALQNAGYATASYVDTAVAGVTVDLSGYYTKTEIDAAGYLTSSDLSNYYTKTEVDTAIAGATGTDLSNYYTKTEVDTAIAGVTVDLSGYYTKTEIDNAGFLTSFSIGDGDTLELGDDSDLQIYYDGTLGVQTSFIDSDALIIRSKTNQEEYITAIEDGPVELYYNGSKKFGTSADGATVLGDLEVDGKVYFKNVFSTLADLPNASSYHGMFAHVHGEGAAYYAHAGNWVKLANDVDIPDLTGYATEAYVTTQISGISSPSNLSDLDDVNIGGTPTTGHVLKWDGSNWAPAPDATGAGGGGIALSDLSVTQNPASGSGALTYNSVSGVFEYTPPVVAVPSSPSLFRNIAAGQWDTNTAAVPTGTTSVVADNSADTLSLLGANGVTITTDESTDTLVFSGPDLSSYSTTLLGLSDVDSNATPANDDVLVYSAADSEFKLENLTSVVSSLSLQNIADAGYGVDVTGKIATTDGIDIDIGGSINAAGTTLDFQNTTVSFTGASIGGLSPSDVNLGNIANAGYGVDVNR